MSALIAVSKPLGFGRVDVSCIVKVYHVAWSQTTLMDTCCKNDHEADKKKDEEKEGCCAECPDKGCEGCDCSKPENTTGCCGGCDCENR